MKKTLIVLFIGISLAFSKPEAKAAGLAGYIISPAAQEAAKGEVVQIQVEIDPKGEIFDTARVKLEYTPGMLNLEGVAKNTKFSQTAGGNSFSDDSGTFSYGSGLPGGTSEKIRFLTLTFRTAREGEAKVYLRDDSLIASNGINVSDCRSNMATIRIGKAKAKVLGVKLYPDGTLLRNSKTREIFYITGGAKKKVASLKELAAYGKKTIINVSPEALDGYLPYANGTLLRNSKTREIFYITGGAKKKVASLKELAAYGKKTIINVSPEVLSQFPVFSTTGSQLAEGALVRDKTSKRIYVVSGGKKSLIATLADLSKYRGRQIIDIDPGLLSQYPTS